MAKVTKESLTKKISQLEVCQKVQTQRGNSLSISEEYQLEAYRLLYEYMDNAELAFMNVQEEWSRN